MRRKSRFLFPKLPQNRAKVLTQGKVYWTKAEKKGVNDDGFWTLVGSGDPEA